MELWKFVFNFVAVGSVSSSGLVFIGSEVFFFIVVVSLWLCLMFISI